MQNFILGMAKGRQPAQASPPQEDGFYNYLRGFWNDGTPYTFGSSGYNPASIDTIKFAFPDDPNDPNGWSMCTVNMPIGDRRFLMSTGPILIQPGAVNELVMAVFNVDDIHYPCPDLTKLKYADGLAQRIFDGCIDEFDGGPNAPELKAIAKDKELTIVLYNESSSNNFNESYIEEFLSLPVQFDPFYRFEGYRIFQLRNALVSRQQLNDTTFAHQIFQTDIQNGAGDLFNWKYVSNPDLTSIDKYIWVPELKVKGNNTGLEFSFDFNEDTFAETEKTLINGKDYHFMAVAYAYNNWLPYDSISKFGQRTPYLQGLSNIKLFTFSPKLIFADDEPRLKVTRLAGEGNPHIFMELDSTMYGSMLSQSFDGKVVYKTGYGPLQAKILDPSKPFNKKYRLEIFGNFNYARNNCAFEDDAVWKLTNITDNVVLLEDKPLSYVKEYVVDNLGFSLTVDSYEEPGSKNNLHNGGIGAKIEYKNPNGPKWFNAVSVGGNINNDKYSFLSFLRTIAQDPNDVLSSMGEGYFVPFYNTKFEPDIDIPFYLSPSARDFMALLTNSTNNSIRYRDLNNVDIVMTSDKSKWSKCIVIETASPDYITGGFVTIGNAKNFEVRQSPSIDKDGNSISGLGFSYFPGYAVDIETGKRLNIFFGENSVYSGTNVDFLEGKNPLGGDMIFNPSSQIIAGNIQDSRAAVAGGQHYIYVTRQAYDGCVTLESKLKKGSSTLSKAKAAPAITWVSFPILAPGIMMKSLADGLIPNDVIIKLRVDNPYGESRKYNIEKERDCETEGDQPVYWFEFDKFVSGIKTPEILAEVFLSPNPSSAIHPEFHLTNLPEDATVHLIDIQGNELQQFNANNKTTENYFGPGDSITRFQVKTELRQGLYFVRIKDNKTFSIKTLKWVVL
ncbi:MAG: T9SS type A sorting domain-containing protein [Saprospiraceae bacterium]|nr:T9SS type A sorting domain-containing protein [Saprospiraceae bacterium]